MKYHRFTYRPFSWTLTGCQHPQCHKRRAPPMWRAGAAAVMKDNGSSEAAHQIKTGPLWLSQFLRFQRDGTPVTVETTARTGGKKTHNTRCFENSISIDGRTLTPPLQMSCMPGFAMSGRDGWGTQCHLRACQVILKGTIHQNVC